VVMDRGGADLRNLEGFMPFRCSNLPDQSDPLTRPQGLLIIGVI
jgi:hypothetical protein